MQKNYCLVAFSGISSVLVAIIQGFKTPIMEHACVYLGHVWQFSLGERIPPIWGGFCCPLSLSSYYVSLDNGIFRRNPLFHIWLSGGFHLIKEKRDVLSVKCTPKSGERWRVGFYQLKKKKSNQNTSNIIDKHEFWMKNNFLFHHKTGFRHCNQPCNFYLLTQRIHGVLFSKWEYTRDNRKS